MTKNIFKTLMMLAVSCVMVFAMSAVVFAAGDGTELTIRKELNVKNATLTKVYGPGIDYTYSVEPANVAAGTKVSGVTVHAGPASGLSVQSTPSFAVTDLLDSSSAGTSNTKNLVLKTNLSAFGTTPGVYRYKLTDTTTAAALTAAGIVRDANFNPDRYIDLYIERADDGSMKIGGYVVESENETTGTISKEDFTGTDKKNAVNTEDGTSNPSMSMSDSQANYTADSFSTYNILLRKNVTGNMGDRTHQFAFAGAITDNGGRKVFVKKGAVATESDTEVTDIPSGVTLAHEEYYSVAGLSPRAKISWTETNNTQDTYKVTVNGLGSSNLVAEVSKAAGETTVLSAQAVTNYESSATQETQSESISDITFTNDFTTVSPTGFVMRFGAPLMILLAGIAAFLTARRVKREQSDLA